MGLNDDATEPVKAVAVDSLKAVSVQFEDAVDKVVLFIIVLKMVFT